MMNPIVKDIMNALVGRPGWNIGTVREMGGGAYDLVKSAVDATRYLKDKIQPGPPGGSPKPQFSDRTAFLLASFLVMGTVGAVLTRILAGEKPKDDRDLFAPRDGGMDGDGNPTRIILPFYLSKDVYNYATKPVATLKAKAAPALTLATDLLTNRNFQNMKIYGEDGMGLGKYLAGAVTPYSASGIEQNVQAGKPLGKTLAPMAGVMPAPKRMGMTAAQEKLDDYMAEKRPGTMLEPSDENQVVRQITQALRRKDYAKARETMEDGLTKGLITDEDVGKALKNSQVPYLVSSFKSLSLEPAIKVMDLASPEERKTFLPLLNKKLDKFDSLPPVEQQRIVQQLKALHLTPAELDAAGQ
jgi:hypothetical protein